MNRSFASDNNAPVHPAIMQAILNANSGDYVSYGDDPYTRQAEKVFEKHFGPDARVFFVFNGTGANVASIAHVLKSHQAVMCAETAHINHDECGAPEKFSGCKLLTVPSADGKLRVDQLRPFLHSTGFEHHAQPKLISITQATELGNVYTLDEIAVIARFAHENDLYLHMDGARISNAAAALGVSFNKMITQTGVDVLSFGGTKNGIMLGEAVVFLNPELAKDFQYIRKQSMQLASKMRYISAQFIALLEGELWLQNARHANKMALILAEKLKNIPGIKINRKVETNAVFVIVPREIIEPLQRQYFFYVWNDEINEVRWMTHFDTSEKDLENFVEAAQKLL